MTSHIRTLFRLRSPRPLHAAAAAIAVVVITVTSCSEITSLLDDCGDVGFPAVLAQIRRPDGRGIAPGATLVVRDGTFSDTSLVGADPLGLGAAENRQGTYTVEVTKPYYSPFKRDGVVVPGGKCGAYKTVIVPVVLTPLTNAPAVRSISVSPSVMFLDAPRTWPFTVYVDAAAGVDTTVTWSLSDPRVGTIDGTGVVDARCGLPQDIRVIATSRYDPSTSGTARVTVSGSICQ